MFGPCCTIGARKALQWKTVELGEEQRVVLRNATNQLHEIN